MQTHNHSPLYRGLEMALLFIVLPLLLAFNPIIYVSLALVAIALIYIAFISRGIWGSGSWKAMFKAAKNAFSLSQNKWGGRPMVLRFAVMFSVFAIGSSAFVWYTMPDDFFHVVMNNTLLWFFISLFYSVFSVLPQEFLYRVYFIERYGDLICHRGALILLNASLFCIAHVMFFNHLVLLLTFCGGLLFSYTYLRTRSFIVVSVEHSFYGLWLYTVGMGAMLAFPSGT